MSFFDTVAGQDIKRLGSGIKKAGKFGLEAFSPDNLFFGTGRDIDLIKGLGQYLMSPAPSQIDEIQATAGLPSSAPKVPINPLINIAASTPSPIEPSLFEKIKPPQALPNTSLIRDGAYTQNQISEILSDLPKAPQALPESPEMTQYKENIATDPKGGDKSLAGGAEAIEGLMNKSIMDYIDNIRGTSPEQAQKVKTLAKYKEEFAEATGLDVSGKPDTKDALVAFGLALMQNKAGKKFNVGNILKATGEAGEKAMPLLQKAKAEAKAAGASAGKYALEMRSADTAKAEAAAEKAMKRGKYYILPKADGLQGFASAMDKARPEYLNVSELNSLVTDPNFSKQYDLITEESFTDLTGKVLDSKEVGDLFSDKTSDVVLFSGTNVDKMFTFQVNNVNPNLPEDKAPKFAKMANRGQSDQIYTALGDALKDLNKFEESFAQAFADIDDGGATLQAQATNFLIQAADRLGIEVDANTPTAGLQKFVTKLQAQNAAEILGEAGKTLSDNDRKLVAQIVGDLPGLLGGSPDVLRAKLEELKTQVLDNKRREILRAFQTMDNYSRNNTQELWGDSDWSDEDQKELIKLRKMQGVNV